MYMYLEDNLTFVHFSDVTDSKALIDDHKIEVKIYPILHFSRLLL